MSPRAVRCLLLNLGLHALLLGVAAPFMVRVIRADGGTAPEYAMYAFYGAVLLLGIDLLLFLLGTAARRVAGDLGEMMTLLAGLTLALLALVADLGTFLSFGLHPYGEVTWAAVGTADIRNLPSWFFLALAAGVLLVAGIVSVTWWLARGEWWLPTVRPARVGWRLGVYFAVGLPAFLWMDRPDAENLIPRAALPLYGLWLAPTRDFAELRPALPLPVDGDLPIPSRRPDLILVMAESLRWDMLTPEQMPHLTALAERHRCTVAERHYAGGHLTQYGTFSLLNGLDADMFLPWMLARRPSMPLALLRQAGYRIEGFDATGVLSYITPPLVPTQFDRYETLLAADSLVVDHLLVPPAAGRDGTEPLAPQFRFGFLYSTHAPYLYPPEFGRLAADGHGPTSRTGLFNRYRNSVAWVDHLIGRLADGLDDRLADGSLGLVITGDHGEELLEFGLYGHASVHFQDVRLRVPLVLCLPGRDPVSSTGITRHADIFPTLFDWMGVDSSAFGFMSGRSMFDSASAPGAVVVAGSGYPVQAPGFAVVTPRYKFWLDSSDPGLREVTLLRVTDAADRPVTPDAQTAVALERALDEIRHTRPHFLQAN